MYKIKQFHFNQISSTNDYAHELLKNEECVAVSADYQWKGRGRNGKEWVGEYGDNVYCTFGFRHDAPPSQMQLVAFQSLGCLAVIAALRNAAQDLHFRLKYPNDVLAGNKRNALRKISGILVEHEFFGSKCTLSLVGIGVNVRQRRFPEQLETTVCSLTQLGVDCTPDSILESLIANMERLVRQPCEKIFTDWRNELSIQDKEIHVVGKDGMWKSGEILDDGRLKLYRPGSGAEIIIDNGDSIRYDA